MKIDRKLQLIAKDGQVLHQLEPYVWGISAGGIYMGLVVFFMWVLQ